MNTHAPERPAQTKILATIGPASNTAEAITQLIEAGASIFRLNFSHGTHEDHQTVVNHIRAIEKQINRSVGIIADMQGPKLRIGSFETGSTTLTEGQSFRFDQDPAPGNNARVCLPHPEILQTLQPGSLIFLDDGNVRAHITHVETDHVQAIIESGTKLSDKKGLNIPGALIPIPALTEKDKIDLQAALNMGVDWIAQSFVQTPQDVQEALDLIQGRAALMVKLEKPAALDHLEDILALADGAMIARGDLGVEIPPERVPAEQKRIIRLARAMGKPVVVATQMLESMITSPRPTRAEASDVATAVYDGTDAVMLSAETAVGAYPARAVTFMSRICFTTEQDPHYKKTMIRTHPDTRREDTSDAIAAAAYHVTTDTNAKAIVTYTTSGSTAIRMSRQRPAVPILCLTPDETVARRLSVCYGIQTIHAPELKGNFSGPATRASRSLIEKNIATNGDSFVMTAGIPFGTPGSTNFLRVAKVEE